MPLRNGLSEELNRQGNEHFARGHYTEAYTCYIKALESDRLTGDRRALAPTLGNLGNICAVSGRRESAESYYHEVLELQKILGDEQGIGTTLANLGNLRADAGEWDRARAYYLEALDIMSRTHDERGKAVLFSDLGLVARETGQIDQALGYYEQSLVLMRRLGDQGGVADAWRMMGRTYLIQKRYEESIACCQTSQAIAERDRDELRVGGARYVAAQCYEEMGLLQEATELLDQVVRMDRKYGLPKLEENGKRLEALRARLAAEGRPPSPPLETSA
jgi:tetratricopeptide (TPR) repeat protein